MRWPMKTLAMAMLLLAGSAHADDWTKTDTGFEAAYAMVHVIDWAQTKGIAGSPDRWHERNPILGAHPTPGEVDAYFAANLAAHVVVSALLPQPYRRAWQCLGIAFTGVMIANNARLGIVLQMPF